MCYLVNLLQTLLTADFLKFFLPLLGAAIAWFVNEHRKRVWEEYHRKEARYQELLRTMRGFQTRFAGLSTPLILGAELVTDTILINGG